jgi:three-Cys-motif partner protein
VGESVEYFDIGEWSQQNWRPCGITARSIRESSPSRSFSHAYIDAFTDPGVHVLRTTGEMVVGSPVNALEIRPPFADYYFINTDGDKVGALRCLAGGPPRVHIFQGDCNELLPENVYPHVRYENYRGWLLGSYSGIHKY